MGRIDKRSETQKSISGSSVNGGKINNYFKYLDRLLRANIMWPDIEI